MRQVLAGCMIRYVSFQSSQTASAKYLTAGLSDPPPVPPDLSDFNNSLEEIYFVIAQVAAAAAGTHMLQDLEHASVLSLEPMTELHIIDQLVAGFLFVVAVQGLIQCRVGAGAGGRVVQVGEQRLLYILRKKALSQKRDHDMAELRFPFAAMGRATVLKMYIDLKVRYLMQECDQKTVGVQVHIDADAVVGMVFRGMAVIAQNAFALVGEREVYGMVLEKRSNQIEGAFRDEPVQQIYGCFLFPHFALRAILLRNQDSNAVYTA